MPPEDKRTHNIVTYAEDDHIVEAVQQRIGSTDYSAAIRFIIREFAVHADPQGKLNIRKPAKVMQA